jgi:hypothetical protein
MTMSDRLGPRVAVLSGTDRARLVPRGSSLTFRLADRLCSALPDRALMAEGTRA